MGKKNILRQVEVKICKKSCGVGDNNKKQLNSLIEVLRPKVYITDSSSFKTLVQQLTGCDNGRITSSDDDIMILNSPQNIVEEKVVVPADHHGNHPESSTSVGSISPSFDEYSSFDESFLQVCSNPIDLAPMADEDMMINHHPIVGFDDHQYTPSSDSSEHLLMDNIVHVQQEEDSSMAAYEDILQSLLFDGDVNGEQYDPFDNVYAQIFQQQQEVSIYDYDVSGLI